MRVNVEVDHLLAERDQPQGASGDRMLAVGPRLGKSLRLGGGKRQEGGRHGAEHLGAPDRAPRGIRFAVEYLLEHDVLKSIIDGGAGRSAPRCFINH